MNIQRGLIGLIISFAFNASAEPAFDKRAHREPGVSWKKYYRAAKKFNPRHLADKNAQEASVKIDKLDMSVVADWGKGIDVPITFFSGRDLRFMETDANPGFLRRISWLYPDDGCFARAAMFVNKLREWQIPDPSKVFIFGDLTVQTPNSPQGKVSWWYHVAPAIRIGESVYILDAAINPYSPMPLIDWVKTMTDDPQRVRLAFCKADSYTPGDSCFSPTSRDAKDAPSDQRYYLDEEWSRTETLGRNAKEILGDNPPWKK